MLTKIEIENFKSIYKETIELGRVNVFIGENGCGKTNILEAVGMASAFSLGKTENEILALKGIRVTKPSITFSSFHKTTRHKAIDIGIEFSKNGSASIQKIHFGIEPENESDINTKWKYSPETEPELWDSEKPLPQGEIIPEMELPEEFAETIRNLPVFMYISQTTTLSSFEIFNLSTDVLRGIGGGNSYKELGLKGENLDRLIGNFSKEEFKELFDHSSNFITWLDKIEMDKEGKRRLEGHNLNLSTSTLYFRDKFMAKKNNIFSAENANEGILHILFYLALFISKKTPKFFGIDNIETALNPYLCRILVEELVKLAKKNDKQVLITTHQPAVLDALNLHDDEQRLFTVSRNLKGYTEVERIKLKPDAQVNGKRLKLSELWMRNYLGAIPQHLGDL